MKISKRTVVVIVLFFVVCILFAYPTMIKAGKTDTIVHGVYIGPIHVGGMTAEEATVAIDEYVSKAEEAKITLMAGEKSIQVSGEQFGLKILEQNMVRDAMAVGNTGNLIKRYKERKDLEHQTRVIPMKWNVDESMVTELLKKESVRFNQAVVNNGLRREAGAFVYVEGAQGITVNIADSVAGIKETLGESWDGKDVRIKLAATIVEPLGTREELSKVRDVLGSCTTNYNDSAQNRCTNISIAAELIDGIVLYPGEEFSVAATIGPLDASKGYQPAGAYENGRTVQAYGGGVCQVSTTLYNAVILAELDITERSNHSMIVSYVKLSMDAAIAGDYKDLKFVNNRETPIYLEGYTKGKNVCFCIYGEETREKGRVVSYESEVISREEPTPQFVETKDPVGDIHVEQSKHVGYVARLWKVVMVDGVEESREIFNKSTYRASPEIIRVGTASEDPKITAAVKEAIATQNAATIYETVRLYTLNSGPEPSLLQEEKGDAS